MQHGVSVFFSILNGSFLNAFTALLRDHLVDLHSDEYHGVFMFPAPFPLFRLRGLGALVDAYVIMSTSSVAILSTSASFALYFSTNHLILSLPAGDLIFNKNSSELAFANGLPFTIAIGESLGIEKPSVLIDIDKHS